MFMRVSGESATSLADASRPRQAGERVGPGPRRFRPELVPTLVLVAVLMVTLAAGRWQLNRAAYKVDLQHRIEAAVSAPPVRVQPADAVDVQSLPWRPIEAVGRFDASRVVLLDNRLRDGVAGYEVLTPFVLSGSSRALLVNRGWVAAPARRDQRPSVVPPAGEVRLLGMATVPSARFMELRADTDESGRWQNWTIERARERWGLDLLPVAMLQTGEAVALEAGPGDRVDRVGGVDRDDKLARVWPRPDVGIDKHRGYALQWFSFALVAIVVWLVLSLRRAEIPEASDAAGVS